MTIDIRVTEVLTRIVTVDAQSTDEAIDIVERDYKQEKIVLDDFDFDQNLIIEKKEESFSSRKDVLINTVVRYLMKDERRHCIELDESEESIYLTLKELQDSLI